MQIKILIGDSLYISIVIVVKLIIDFILLYVSKKKNAWPHWVYSVVSQDSIRFKPILLPKVNHIYILYNYFCYNNISC